ncbi:MAG: DUF4239 domain-containing protein [Gammaproteobacteria bacterium]|nr:DUF4239 domain-containing protein [Gammaproteobacteria bacterium]
MPQFVYSTSDLFCFLILVSFTILIAIIFIFINKHFFFHVLRYKDNPTVSSFSALIGIIYGVLVGFVCLYLLNNYDHSIQAIQAEANAASTILRRSMLLSPHIQKVIEKDIHSYVNEVIHHEWPMMARFQKIDQQGDLILIDLIDNIKNYKPKTEVEIIIFKDLLTSSIKELYNARHTRIMISSNTLGDDMWCVILIGTILIIASNYAFRANFYLHLFLNILFAIMAGSMLFLIVSLDRPFQGAFAVTPEPFEDIVVTLNMMQAKKVV